VELENEGREENVVPAAVDPSARANVADPDAIEADANDVVNNQATQVAGQSVTQRRRDNGYVVFPPEIMEYIMYFMTTRTLLRLASTSTRLLIAVWDWLNRSQYSLANGGPFPSRCAHCVNSSNERFPCICWSRCNSFVPVDITWMRWAVSRDRTWEPEEERMLDAIDRRRAASEARQEERQIAQAITDGRIRHARREERKRADEMVEMVEEMRRADRATVDQRIGRARYEERASAARFRMVEIEAMRVEERKLHEIIREREVRKAREEEQANAAALMAVEVEVMRLKEREYMDQRSGAETIRAVVGALEKERRQRDEEIKRLKERIEELQKRADLAEVIGKVEE
jgi:hypothetical protein